MAGATTRLGIPFPEEADNISEGATKIKEGIAKIDEISVAAVAPSIINTEESRTNAAYGVLGTPDEVTIKLPTNGLIAVVFWATWKSSVEGAGRAALFLGENQLHASAAKGGESLKQLVVAAKMTKAAAGQTAALASICQGLGSANSGTLGYNGDVTTGQTLGASLYSWTTDTGSSDISSEEAVGAPCYIWAAAGTYKISVRFKSASGSVTASNRKLWAWVMP